MEAMTQHHQVFKLKIIEGKASLHQKPLKIILLIDLHYWRIIAMLIKLKADKEALLLSKHLSNLN